MELIIILLGAKEGKLEASHRLRCSFVYFLPAASIRPVHTLLPRSLFHPTQVPCTTPVIPAQTL